MDRMSCEDIHQRHRELGERASDALPRLLELRARLMRSSSQLINSGFRDQLIYYIDHGRWQ